MFTPSVKNCSEKDCEHLIQEEWYGRKRKICALAGRIPGNIHCPLEEGPDAR